MEIYSSILRWSSRPNTQFTLLELLSLEMNKMMWFARSRPSALQLRRAGNCLGSTAYEVWICFIILPDGRHAKSTARNYEYWSLDALQNNSFYTYQCPFKRAIRSASAILVQTPEHPLEQSLSSLFLIFEILQSRIQIIAFLDERRDPQSGVPTDT